MLRTQSSVDTAPRSEPKQAAPASGLFGPTATGGTKASSAPSTAPAGDAPTPSSAPVKAQIAGESLSTVSFNTVGLEMKKLGWTQVLPKDHRLQMEGNGRRVKLDWFMTNAGATAEIELIIVRPNPHDLDRESSIPDAKATAATLRDAATHLDGDVLVAVAMWGNKAEAQKDLDALVKN